jgi:hypothetical protein
VILSNRWPGSQHEARWHETSEGLREDVRDSLLSMVRNRDLVDEASFDLTGEICSMGRTEARDGDQDPWAALPARSLVG